MNNKLKLGLFLGLFLAVFLFLRGEVYAYADAAGVAVTQNFPSRSNTTIDGVNPSTLYLTVGTGDFDVTIAGATILANMPGTYTLTIYHARWCNDDDIDLPLSGQFEVPYINTDYYVKAVRDDVNGNPTPGAIKGKYEAPRTSDGKEIFEENCTNKDITITFTLGDSDYDQELKKYVAIAYGTQLYKTKNPDYISIPAAAENSFRFQISGPNGSNVGMTLLPPSVFGNFYNFSNRGRSSDSKLSSKIFLTTPCSVAAQNVSITFYDVDDYVDYSTGGRGVLQSNTSPGSNFNFPLKFNVRRALRDTTDFENIPYSYSHPTMTAWNDSSVIGPTKIFGGQRENSQEFNIRLEREYKYEFSIADLSKVNTISFKFSTNIDPLFGDDICNTAPSGSINVTCNANGLVTVRSATIKDTEGGRMNIAVTAPVDADTARGSAIVDAGIAENISFSSGTTTFTRPRDGTTRTVSLTVTDPEGLSRNISGSYTCPVPPAKITSCGFTDIPTFESGGSTIPSMTIYRNGDAFSPDITVNAKVEVEGTRYSSTKSGIIITAADGSATRNFDVFTPPGVDDYTLTGTVTQGTTTLTICTTTVTVANKPFFTVTGGDLMVGGAYYTNDCSPTNANLASWSVATSAGRTGASASHVAQVLGTARGFYSSDSIEPPALYKKWLTIANTSDNAWGGGSGIGTCMKDIYGSTIDNPAPIGADNFTVDVDPSNIQVSKTGNLTLNSNVQGAAGSRFTGKQAIYVTGNVYITGNIAMKISYSSRSDIPFFALIVKGNIFISPEVTQLDGMYVAQPDDSGNKGRIFTCKKSLNDSYTKDELFGSCSKRLIFRGIVQAKDIKLYRTIGTLSTDVPAEEFTSLPELYLADTPFKQTTTNTGKFDSAVTLPPLL